MHDLFIYFVGIIIVQTKGDSFSLVWVRLGGLKRAIILHAYQINFESKNVVVLQQVYW